MLLSPKSQIDSYNESCGQAVQKGKKEWKNSCFSRNGHGFLQSFNQWSTHHYAVRHFSVDALKTYPQQMSFFQVEFSSINRESDHGGWIFATTETDIPSDRTFSSPKRCRSKGVVKLKPWSLVGRGPLRPLQGKWKYQLPGQKDMCRPSGCRTIRSSFHCIVSSTTTDGSKVFGYCHCMSLLASISEVFMSAVFCLTVWLTSCFVSLGSR